MYSTPLPGGDQEAVYFKTASKGGPRERIQVSLGPLSH